MKRCWLGIEFDCCQGEDLLSRFGPLPEIGESVSLADTSRWCRNKRRKAEKGVKIWKEKDLDVFSIYAKFVSDSCGWRAELKGNTNFLQKRVQDKMKFDTTFFQDVVARRKGYLFDDLDERRCLSVCMIGRLFVGGALLGPMC
jgi:hypothetical protein